MPRPFDSAQGRLLRFLQGREAILLAQLLGSFHYTNIFAPVLCKVRKGRGTLFSRLGQRDQKPGATRQGKIKMGSLPSVPIYSRFGIGWLGCLLFQAVTAPALEKTKDGASDILV